MRVSGVFVATLLFWELHLARFALLARFRHSSEDDSSLVEERCEADGEYEKVICIIIKFLCCSSLGGGGGLPLGFRALEIVGFFFSLVSWTNGMWLCSCADVRLKYANMWVEGRVRAKGGAN